MEDRRRWTADDLGRSFDTYEEAVNAEKEFFYQQASEETVVNYLSDAMLDTYALIEWAMKQPGFFNEFKYDYVLAAETYAADWVSPDDF